MFGLHLERSRICISAGIEIDEIGIHSVVDIVNREIPGAAEQPFGWSLAHFGFFFSLDGFFRNHIELNVSTVIGCHSKAIAISINVNHIALIEIAGNG